MTNYTTTMDETDKLFLVISVFALLVISTITGGAFYDDTHEERCDTHGPGYHYASFYGLGDTCVYNQEVYEKEINGKENKEPVR